MASALSGAVWLWRRWQAAPAAEERIPVATATAPAQSTASPEAAQATDDRPDAAADVVEEAASPPASGVDRIVYVNNRGELATVDPAGENGRTLTESNTRFRFPAWSPDGRWVAAIGANRQGAGVYVLPDAVADDEPAPRYFSAQETPIYLYWAPDGDAVSFIANDEAEGLALYLAPAGGGESRKIATGSPFYWDWLGDGRRVLAHSGAADEAAWLAVLGMSDEGDEASLGAPGFFQSPAISDNGRYWAYATSAENGLSWITVRDTETEEEARQRHAGVVAMSWRPGHDQLAVISGQPQSDNFYGPLRLLDAATGEQRLLTRNLVLAFFWSPDGRYLAYISIPGQSDDLVAEAGERTRRGKTAVSRPQPAQNGFAHRFSLRLIDVAGGGDRLLGPIRPTFSFLSQFLPFFDQYARSHRLWSPDSTALVLPQRLEGENQIMVFSVDGEDARSIAEGDMPFWSP
jgi:TolB protein